MGETTSTHLVTAALAILTVVGLAVLRSRREAPVRYLGWAAAGCVPWSLSVAATYHFGLDSAAPILWMPSVTFTAGAVLLWARTFALFGWTPAPRLILLWLAVPAVMLVVRTAVGAPSRTPIFALNTVYSFGLLVAATMIVARRSNDPNPAVRSAVRLMLAGSVGALVAEALRLQLTDTVAVLTIAALTVVAARHGEQMWPRPHAEALLDDLGALVFVFDRDAGLVDLNAPARLFYSLRGVAPPSSGTTAAELLGRDPGELDAVTLELEAGADRTRFSGYVQRLPSRGSPPRGWLVLLRRSVHGSVEDGRRDARRAAMNRLTTYDPLTGLPAERAVDRALEDAATFASAAEIPAAALVLVSDTDAQLASMARETEAAWATRLETIVLGRYGPRGVVLVVRDVAAAELEAWAGEREEAGVWSATSAGSLASARSLVEAAAEAVTETTSRGRPGG